MRPEIQFLSTKPMLGYGTTQMRCVQPAEFLRAGGWHCSTAGIHQDLPRSSRLLVLHRVPADALTLRAVAIARAEGVPVIYDVDDLIFDPDGEDHLQGFSSGKAADNLTLQFRKAMTLCDCVSASTEFLKERIDRFHPACTVMPNGISRSLLERGNARRPPRPADQVTLAYYSGSAHHDADFALIQPALRALLEAEASTRLLIVGKLAFDKAFESFGDRFEYRPFLPYDAFIDSLGDADINLVPLVTASPFAQARSELKYIESAAFGVPTVASPTRTYAQAIRDGETGLLCKDAHWFDTLRDLVKNPELRLRLGHAARVDAVERYGPDAMTRRWDSFVTEWARPKPPALSHSLAASPLRARQAGTIALRRAKALIRGRAIK